MQDKQQVRVLMQPGVQLPGCKFVEVTGKVQGDKSVRMVRDAPPPPLLPPPGFPTITTTTRFQPPDAHTPPTPTHAPGR